MFSCEMTLINKCSLMFILHASKFAEIMEQYSVLWKQSDLCPHCAVLLIRILRGVEEHQIIPGLFSHLPEQHVPIWTAQHVADPVPRHSRGFHHAADPPKAAAGQSPWLQCMNACAMYERFSHTHTLKLPPNSYQKNEWCWYTWCWPWIFGLCKSLIIKQTECRVNSSGSNNSLITLVIVLHVHWFCILWQICKKTKKKNYWFSQGGKYVISLYFWFIDII